jgi:hypothetical protein
VEGFNYQSYDFEVKKCLLDNSPTFLYLDIRTESFVVNLV